MITGYCCNVHPGTTLQQVKQNLEKHSVEVKRICSPNDFLPVGLWLSKSTVDDLSGSDKAVLEFRDWLDQRGLIPFTINGFPYGDFHQEVVKTEVYRPTWADPSRLNYTIQLARIQRLLAGKQEFQSISTLPLGWPGENGSALTDQQPEFLKACAANLKSLAQTLAEQQQEFGVQTMVCIEPEPGCVIDTAQDIADFFGRYLLDGSEEENKILLRHIGVCHDICHSAVMFEDQDLAVQTYDSVGAKIGKVQVSSALSVAFAGGGHQQDMSKIEQLKTFSEPKYLHQTKVQRSNGEYVFHEDLGHALSSFSGESPENWRVHFHVPLFLERIGLLETTQHEITKLMRSLSDRDHAVAHFEIETYAWNVLPDRESIATDSLAGGIAKEIEWFRSVI